MKKHKFHNEKAKNFVIKKMKFYNEKLIFVMKNHSFIIVLKEIFDLNEILPHVLNRNGFVLV